MITEEGSGRATSQDTAMRMYAFHCGEEATLRSLYDPFDADCAATIRPPYFFYLIRHPEADVLFDCGGHPALVDDPRSRLGAAADLYDIAMAPGDDVVSRLHTLAVEPEAIGHVVQSHLHYDHAGGLEFLSEATVYVQRAELPFAYWPPVYQQGVYARGDFDPVTRWKPLNGDYDVFNDGQLLIFPTPGHTPGHQSLLVRLAGQSIILVGDAAYDREKMAHRCLPGLLWNPDALVESWERIEELQRREGAELIFTHDLDWEKTIKLAPEAWYE